MACVSVFAQNSAGNCYRGFIDAGYSLGVGDYTFGRFEVHTSHGYQVSPYFFIGLGVGMHLTPSYSSIIEARDSEVDIPGYFDMRINFSKGKLSPFFDGRLGTYLNHNGGLYYNLALGLRLATSRKQAIYLAVGYARSQMEFVHYQVKNNILDKETYESITLRLGFEF